MNLIAFTLLINVEQIHVHEPMKTFDDISRVITVQMLQHGIQFNHFVQSEVLWYFTTESLLTDCTGP